MKSTWFAVFLIGSSMTLTGCGDSETEAPATSEQARRTAAPAAAGGSNNPFLAQVDAGTEYLFANVERLPEDVLDKYWALNEASTMSNQQILTEIENDEEVPPAAQAMLREFFDLTTREGWTSAGLHDNPYYAFHSVNLLPFVQLELTDGEAFAEFIGRFEASMDEPLPRRDIDGSEVIWMELESGFGVALHHNDDFVSAALIPDDATLLARVAGQYDPAQPYSIDDFSEFNGALGFTANGSGYLDWRLVLDEVLSEDGLLAQMDEDGELAAVREDPACVSEFQALADHFPRTVFGYTRINESTADMLVRQEMSESLASGLMPIAGAPVNVDRELNGLVNFGLAIDLVAAREFARGLVDGWIANPPQCEAFSEIASDAPTWKESLARPIPPVVTNIHGLFLELNSLEVEDMLPTGGGVLSLYMNNPQFLVGMAQMFAPAVAELQLEPGSEPQQVPPGTIPQLDALGQQVWIAMGEAALGLAVGEDNVDSLNSALESSDADDLLMAGRMDFSIMTTAIDMAESMVDDAEAREALDVQRQSYQALAELYEEGVFKLRLGEQGMDFIVEAKLR